MARRKKTPDVLADQQHAASQTVEGGAKKAETPVAPLLPNAAPLFEESASDPLAMLFPHPVSVPISVTTTIKLTVTATEDLVREIESSVSQALGALPQVQVEAEEADWTLVILSVVVQSPSRRLGGVALSVIVVETPKDQLQEQRRSQAGVNSAISSERLRIFHGAWLRVAARSQLQRLCQQIVTDFAERYLARDSRFRGNDASA